MKKLVLVLVLLVASVGISAQSVTSHTVQRGESIESIAQKYGISVSDLISANPDAKDYFFVGMKLTIPAKSNIAPQPNDQINIITTRVNSNIETTDSQTDNDVIKDNDNPEFHDGYLMYQPKAKMYGIGYYTHFGYYGFIVDATSNLKFGSDDSSVLTFKVGPMIGPFFKLADENLMMGINIAPYIGITGYDDIGLTAKGNPKKDFKTKFAYGALARLTLAVKLAKNKKGKDTYLTGGYQVEAAEFKTKDMFKYGYWTLGFAVRY